MTQEKKIQLLKDYFQKQNEILLAFVFGSRAKGKIHLGSDWDIAVYFKPKEYAELETNFKYQKEDEIWSDLGGILKANEIDFVVLNRARPSLVFDVLNSGIPLTIKDRKIYLELLAKTHYEAIDFRNFIFDFWKIRERSKSLSQKDKAILIEHLVFLENEFKDFEKFKELTIEEYSQNRDKKRNLERWVENLVMSSLDIAKITLSSEKKEVPETYKDALRQLGLLYFNSEFAEKFSQFADLRNIVAHEYLDMRWERIKKFIKDAEDLYPIFIEKIKATIK